jgi:hypothetical protein
MARDKHTSLTGFFISGEEKKFYDIDHSKTASWCQPYKTFSS